MAPSSMNPPCPRCRRQLTTRRYRRAQITACLACKGILADREAIEQLVPESDRLWQRAPSRRPAPVDCPRCRHAMAAIIVGGVELDRCDDDSVIWFDGAELMRFEPPDEKRPGRAGGASHAFEAFFNLLDIFT